MADLPEACKTSCVECPWRRTSAPGWLGPHDAMEWVGMVHAETPIACHMTIEVEDDWTTPRIRQCAGAASYRANVGKRPRDPEVAVGPVDDLVFASPYEFLNHHAQRERFDD